MDEPFNGIISTPAGHLNIFEDLSIRKMRVWLAGKPATERVGLSRERSNYPLANYLRERGYPIYGVTPSFLWFNDGSRIELDAIGHDDETRQYAADIERQQRLILDIDATIEWQTPVTAAQAIYLIDNPGPHMNERDDD